MSILSNIRDINNKIQENQSDPTLPLSETFPTQGESFSGNRVNRHYGSEGENYVPIVPHEPITGADGKTANDIPRQGKYSIFNRYSIFFFNNDVLEATSNQNYLNNKERIQKSSAGTDIKYKCRQNPTAKNVIDYARTGDTNSVDYDWPDFLWCKNYGALPNNLLVTLRRFPFPVADDLLNKDANKHPDIGRMVTWVDGETNKWESVGLKFNMKFNWKPLESGIQDAEIPNKQGGEFNAIKSASGVWPGASKVGTAGKVVTSLSPKNSGLGDQLLKSKEEHEFDPWAKNSNPVYGPIDVIKKMFTRESGLEFTQELSLVFEYELRSIDGINPRIAFIDLLSNILVCTYNRGNFWGGDIRWKGGQFRHVNPLGDPSKLRSGDWGGFFSSVLGGLKDTFSSLTGGAGNPLDALKNAAGNLGSFASKSMAGGALDAMGRPGLVAVNALLTGESTGEWHVTVGNPADPIMSIGNLILDGTDIDIGGPLGNDDFPSKITVTCKLKPARMRDRSDIMGMFHRNGRTYIAEPPQSKKYAGNITNFKSKKEAAKQTLKGGDNQSGLNENNLKYIDKDTFAKRWPNHSTDESMLNEVTKGTKELR